MEDYKAAIEGGDLPVICVALHEGLVFKHSVILLYKESVMH